MATRVASRGREGCHPGVRRCGVWAAMVAGWGAAVSVLANPSVESTPAAERRLTWPEPPAEARIAYVTSLHGPADVGRHRSVWSRVSGLVTGNAGIRDDLVKPFALGVDDDGSLWVADSGPGVVFQVDLARHVWHRFEASGGTHFVAPVGVAARAGVAYVADAELGKVLAFRSEKQTVFEIGAPLRRPSGLALEGDTLFVADPPAHAVLAFDLRGQFRFQFGRRGAAPGEFNFPTHLASDGRGHLYVTDSMNCRVEVFDTTGKFLRAVGSNGDTSGHFSRPKGVAAGPNGHIFVVDALFDNVQAFDEEGRLLLYWGGAGGGPGEFWLPNGTAVGPNGRLYVADTFNHRIQVFDRIGSP